jgi:ABC-type Fe3+/spermidine/putrescine transport system ATPase subunit
MARIQLENLCRNYGPVQAVVDVSLQIQRGEFVTLLGPSGSGKTTTMRMIAGLEAPSSGTIAIDDKLVSGNGVFVPTRHRMLGMVFQSYAVWPHKTVYENVVFPLKQRNVPRAEQRRRVLQMLDHVGLGSFSERYPSQLSGGQQQRVSLARALVAEPEVVLFDEPLSNLDAQLRDSMRELLAHLHRTLRTTSIYVTHDQTEAIVLSDRICIMNQGRLVQSGTPEELYERPTTRFAAEFLGNANVVSVRAMDRSDSSVSLEGGHTLKVGRIAPEASENALIIRPHALRFAQPGETTNVIEGTVRSVSYLGDRVRYSIDIACKGPLMMELVGTLNRRSIGEQVKIFFEPEFCSVV